jgi:hypothetical protein
MERFRKVFDYDESYILQAYNEETQEWEDIEEEYQPYKDFLKDGYSPEILPYVSEEDAEKEEKLLKAKIEKIAEIKESWKNADSGKCLTGIKCLDGEELIIQYSQFDREIWSKKVPGIILEMFTKGFFEVVDKMYEPLPNTRQITELEATQITLGEIPPRIYLMVKDETLDVRDYNNKFHKITVEMLQKAAIIQNLQVEKDLYKKWTLEAQIAKATNIKEVTAIKW